MTFSLIWMPEVLRNAGLKVAEVEGWTTRGRGEMGRVRGVMCHHTGTTAQGNMPTLKTLKDGRHDLSGPLAQLGLGRDGTYYVIAAGRANHAGNGEWRGIATGNSSFIGIEAENAGTAGATWPEVQVDAYRRGVAALLKHIGADSGMCCGHKEYSLPRGRKPDPLFEMEEFRRSVDLIVRGVGVIRPLIPAIDAASRRPTLFRGSRGDHVRIVQRVVGVEEDGKFGPNTEAAVRRLQRVQQRTNPEFVDDGIVGPKTWEVIDAALKEKTKDKPVPDGGLAVARHGSTGEVLQFEASTAPAADH